MVLENYQHETLMCIETVRRSEAFLQALARGEDTCRTLSLLATADVCSMMPVELTPAQSAQKVSDWHRYVREQCSLKHAGEQGIPVPLDELNAFRIGLRGAMRFFYSQNPKVAKNNTGDVLRAINRRVFKVDL